MIAAVAVFCGSQAGKHSIYTTHTQALGKIIAHKKIKLIYGGGHAGLMGVIADTVLENGGEVVGIIPKLLDTRECSHRSITSLIIVNTMHQRKKMMYELCDAAIALPGGYGTLDELFEMITWNQLSIHNKPIYLMNTEGYYNPLLQHINNMYENGFLYAHPLKRITVINNPTEIEKLFHTTQ